MDTATKTKSEEEQLPLEESKDVEEMDEYFELEKRAGKKEKEPLLKPEKSQWDVLFPIILAACLLIALGSGFFMGALLRPVKEVEAPPAEEEASAEVTDENGLPEWITEAYLTVDGVSRSGKKLEAVRDIAVHYVANPGSGAMANRNYFEGKESTTSSHFIVGLEGEILILIPTDEQSVATNERNPDTISVEVCHPDSTGKFSPPTYKSLIRLLAYLCNENGLTEENLIRHHDVTGKMCPLYYVEHPEAWEKIKSDVKESLAKGDYNDPAA